MTWPESQHHPSTELNTLQCTVQYLILNRAQYSIQYYTEHCTTLNTLKHPNTVFNTLHHPSAILNTLLHPSRVLNTLHHPSTVLKKLNYPREELSF